MPHQLPKLQFQRDQFITLNEGFDRTGRFMFPQDWTGYEALAWPEPDPQNLSEELSMLEKDFERHSKRARALLKINMSGMSDEDWQEYDNLVENAGNLKETARQRLSQFGQVFDSRYADALAYERRTSVETHLCQLIRNQEVDVRLGHGTGYQLDNWFATDRFRISFAFSLIIAPKQYGRRRRFPAYFSRQSFNIWASPFETVLKQNRTDSIEEQMIEWFLIYRADCLSRSRKVRQEDVKADCERHFDRNDIGRKFEAVWKLLAVDDMKQLGRKKKTP